MSPLIFADGGYCEKNVDVPEPTELYGCILEMVAI
jgi:hypothetical protein